MPSLNLQPDATIGKDTYVDAATNYGTATYMYAGHGSARKLSAYLEFDLSSIIGIGAIIDTAVLSLYRHYYGSNVTLYVKACTSSWTELGLVLANSPTLDATKYDEHALGTGYDDWPSWNIKDLVQRIASGSLSNYGFTIQGDSVADLKEYFRTSDYTNTPYRPKLDITYHTVVNSTLESPVTNISVEAKAPSVSVDVSISCSLADIGVNALVPVVENISYATEKTFSVSRKMNFQTAERNLSFVVSDKRK
jgi:hypothetical protein